MIERMLRWLFRAKPVDCDEASIAMKRALEANREIDKNQPHVDAIVENARRTVAASDEQIARNHVNEVFTQAFRRPGK